MLKQALIVFSLFLLSTKIIAQTTAKEAFEKIALATDTYHKKMPAERVYLQTDKQDYFIGDTLWLKSYVLTASDLKPSLISPILYIELHDRQNEMVRRISIKITKGIGNAQIALIPEIFASGDYTLIAYTNWMRNFDQKLLFKKKIYIGDARSWLIDLKAIVTDSLKKDLSRVSFDLKTRDFKPVALQQIKVKVLDDERTYYEKEVETSQSGDFSFQFLSGKTSNGNGLRMEITGRNKENPVPRLTVPLNPDHNRNIDVQFLPEGGHLVAGLKSTIGFKAIGQNGLGIAVAGQVYDTKNNLVASFEALHSGMGTFTMTPILGETYKAIITGDANSVYKLPVVLPIGSVLHIENQEDSDSITVNINTSKGFLKADSNYFLLGTSRGIIRFAQNINSSTNTLRIHKRVFLTGIVVFTFLRNHTPLNERIAFVDHHEDLKINLQSDKQVYKTRDSIVLDLEVKDKFGRPVPGNFSLAVTHDGEVDADDQNNVGIQTSLMLNGNLKGHVENPGFYIHRQSPMAWRALDNLLIIQGWRGFEWANVFSGAVRSSYKPEQRYTDVDKERPISFTSNDNIMSNPWFLNIPESNTALKTSLIRLEKEELKRGGNLLREVKIVSGKRNYNAMNLNGYGQADIVLDTNDIRTSKASGLYQLLKQKWPDLSIEYTHVGDFVQGYTLKINDQWVKIRVNGGTAFSNFAGTPEDLKRSINRTLVDNILTVEIMYSQKYLWKYFPPNLPQPFVPGNRARVVEAYAKAGVSPPTNEVKEYAVVQVTTVNRILNEVYSFTSPVKFYSPKYTADIKISDADYRPTIFWEPNVVADANGKARIIFYASNLSGSYTLNLQGTDMNGNVGSVITKVTCYSDAH